MYWWESAQAGSRNRSPSNRCRSPASPSRYSNQALELAPRPGTHAKSGAVVHRSTANTMLTTRFLPECIAKTQS